MPSLVFIALASNKQNALGFGFWDHEALPGTWHILPEGLEVPAKKKHNEWNGAMEQPGSEDLSEWS
jgi:hypothetical protein